MCGPINPPLDESLKCRLARKVEHGLRAAENLVAGTTLPFGLIEQEKLGSLVIPMRDPCSVAFVLKLNAIGPQGLQDKLLVIERWLDRPEGAASEAWRCPCSCWAICRRPAFRPIVH